MLTFSGLKVWKLSPNLSQVSKLNQEIGNAQIIRNHFLRTRNHAIERGATHLSPTEYRKCYYPCLLKRYFFLQYTDDASRDALLGMLNLHLCRLESGGIGPLPRIATPGSLEGNQYFTQIQPTDIMFPTGMSPRIKLPHIGTVPINLPEDFVIPQPDREGRLTLCILRENNEYSIVFVTYPVRQRYLSAYKKAIRPCEPPEVKKARRHYNRTKRPLLAAKARNETASTSAQEAADKAYNRFQLLLLTAYDEEKGDEVVP